MKNQAQHLIYAFTLLIAFSFSKTGSAQTNDNDWILVKDSNEIQFYFKTVLCDNAETLLYKIKNNNSETARINWTIWGIGTDEVIAIPGNQEEVGSCNVENKLSYPLPTGAGLTDNKLPIVFTEFN